MKNNEMNNRIDSEYIIWLCNYLDKKIIIYNDDYNNVDIDETNKDNFKRLNLLYEIISNYANNNYIYALPSKYGKAYKFKFEGIGMEIGILYNSDKIIYCRKNHIINKNEFIDFYDIIENRKKENVDNITYTLNNLSQEIINAYKTGIPYEAINDYIINTLESIKEQDEKKLVRKWEK